MVFQPWTLGIFRGIPWLSNQPNHFQVPAFGLLFFLPPRKTCVFSSIILCSPTFRDLPTEIMELFVLLPCNFGQPKVWMTEGQWLVQDHWVRISLRRQMGVGAKQQTTTQRWEMKPATIIQVRFLVFAGGRFDIIKLSMTGFNPLFCWPFHLVGFGLPNHTWHVHEFWF